MTALDKLKTSVMNDKENQEKYNMERDRYQLMKYLKELRKAKGITQKELAQKMGYSQQGMNDITPISLQSDLDLDKNLSHYDLLDTDQNRLKIRKLFHTSFPQSNLLTFICSENDQNKYVLEFSVYISYEDLENLWGKLYPKEGMR